MNRQFKGIGVDAFDKRCHSYNECGKSIDAIFPQCVQIEHFNLESASKDPNVDAVLIELDQDMDTFEFRAVTSEQLQSAGFDSSNPPMFSGEVVSLPDPDPDFDDDRMDRDKELPNSDPMRKISRKISNKLDSVVKYGTVTGLTIGNLYHSPVHVRFVQEKLALRGKFCCALMCDQIEIQSLPQGQFFKIGDSGSFVFCINPDKTLSCLGMAVGLSTRESCLVTHFGRILENLCPGARLKPCTSLIQQPRTNTPPQTTLDSILAAIESVKSGVDRKSQTLQTLQTNVRTLESQVQQIEDSKTQSSSNQSSANQN